MLEMIRKPPLCFREAIRKHFFFKRKEVKDQCEQWAKDLELHVNDKQIGQSVSKSLIALKRHMNQLYDELDRLEIEETNEQEMKSGDEDSQECVEEEGEMVQEDKQT